MKLKNRFFHKIFASKTLKNLRNFLGIKPTHLMLNHYDLNLSVSDGFFWRVDNEFNTIFNFTDLIDLFFNKKSSEINLIFFDNNFNLIKKFKLEKFKKFNSINIDKKFLNIDKGYGSFYIFHGSNENLNTIIRNSCYTGYSFKKNIPSFVHGNLHSAFKRLSNKVDTITYGLGAKSYYQEYIYKVQNYMDFDKTEIVLLNNSNTKIKVDLGYKKFYLENGCVSLEDIKNVKLISIKSNSRLLRPIIFNYRGEFIDVYHG